MSDVISMPLIRIVYQSGDDPSVTWHTLNPDGSYDAVGGSAWIDLRGVSDADMPAAESEIVTSAGERAQD